jgi:hypothetical protein
MHTYIHTHMQIWCWALQKREFVYRGLGQETANTLVCTHVHTERERERERDMLHSQIWLKALWQGPS